MFLVFFWNTLETCYEITCYLWWTDTFPLYSTSFFFCMGRWDGFCDEIPPVISCFSWSFVFYHSRFFKGFIEINGWDSLLGNLQYPGDVAVVDI